MSVIVRSIDNEDIIDNIMVTLTVAYYILFLAGTTNADRQAQINNHALNNEKWHMGQDDHHVTIFCSINKILYQNASPMLPQIKTVGRWRLDIIQFQIYSNGNELFSDSSSAGDFLV